MGYWIPLILIIFAGGLAQTMAGFGSAVVMMLVLPHLLPMTKAAALASVLGGVVLSSVLLWKYRADIRPRFVLLTGIPYMIASVTVLQFVQRIDTRVMAILFGVFLTVLGLYYLIWSGRARLRLNLPTILICTVVSGATSALFGMGGPLMSLMYLEKYETREEYAANLQLLFLIAAGINTAIRASKGIITADLLPSMAVGLFVVLAGEWAGARLAGLMKPELLRKMIYVMVLFSGVITIMNNI